MSCDVSEAMEEQENEQILILQPLPSQLILQPFRRFTNVTAHSPNLLSLHLHHMYFTYVTWRTAHGLKPTINFWAGCLSFFFLHLCFNVFLLKLHTDRYPREWSRGMREGAQKLELHVQAYIRCRSSLTVLLMQKFLIHSSRRDLILCKCCSNVTVDVFCLHNNYYLACQSYSYCRSKTNSSHDCYSSNEQQVFVFY